MCKEALICRQANEKKYQRESEGYHLDIIRLLAVAHGICIPAISGEPHVPKL